MVVRLGEWGMLRVFMRSDVPKMAELLIYIFIKYVY